MQIGNEETENIERERERETSKHKKKDQGNYAKRNIEIY